MRQGIEGILRWKEFETEAGCSSNCRPVIAKAVSLLLKVRNYHRVHTCPTTMAKTMLVFSNGRQRSTIESLCHRHSCNSHQTTTLGPAVALEGYLKNQERRRQFATAERYGLGREWLRYTSVLADGHAQASNDNGFLLMASVDCVKTLDAPRNRKGLFTRVESIIKSHGRRPACSCTLVDWQRIAPRGSYGVATEVCSHTSPTGSTT